MPDIPGPRRASPLPTAPASHRRARPIADRTAAEAAPGPEPPPVAHRVGWGFISLYALAYMGTILLFLAPLLVTLALKVNSLVGIERAPNSLALVAGIGALLAMFANPFFGRMSDRTSSRLGMRRPWMVIGLVGGSARHPRRRGGAQHPGRPGRMVHRPAVLQRAARRHGGGAAGPGPGRPTRPGLRCPGRLPAHRVGERHLPGPAVHRQPARHVPGPVRDRRVLHPALRGHAERSPAGRRRTSRPGRCGSSPARSTSTRGRTRTSPGPSPAASCSCWPTPS